METKKCSGCKLDKNITEYYKNKARGDGLSPLCVICHTKDTNERSQRNRIEAIELLGNKCSNIDCAVPGGMTDIRALQFDHIDGGGNERQRNGENGHQVIKQIREGSKEFQLLCANCNWIKKFESNETVGKRQYLRSIPTEKVIGIGKGNHPNAQAALIWNRSDEEKQIAKEKYSETRRFQRELASLNEKGETHFSWLKLNVQNCTDCKTRLKPHRSKNMCNTCYTRNYNKSR